MTYVGSSHNERNISKEFKSRHVETKKTAETSIAGIRELTV